MPGAADRPPPAGGSSAIVWARTAERRRPRLTREAIVDAAVAMADAEGLEAVSIRRVAAALDARPMSLYSHFDRKDDLLALMNDQVAAEVIVPEPLPTDWRDALRAIAHRTRDSSLRHPWVLQTLACHPRLGPNGLRHAEQSAAAVAALPLPPRRRAAMLRAVDTYTLGHVTAELRERQGYLGGADRAEVQRYLTGVLDGGQYPHLAQFHSQDLVLVGENARDSFAEGLEWLLAGIAAAIGAAPS
ncbi:MULTISPECIES: TetR/AcrR family transcriptional regulator [Frankia]|uniref:TetR-family regulatory protein n=1 Tax=Frankia alni (strain DSM 45986 / CECT 9034 / ACN14a) TaxID=326424 RepID=Q0RPB1_FRAAA|nr:MULTISPECIES: TetR/AcrR family transcriptional regulator [Frankia]CAJ60621.1 putative tetR-family regulatory protein [Frankia alni ACN14a]